VVPHEARRPDRAELLRLNALPEWAEVITPGEVVLDGDGVPIGVGPSTTEVVHRSFTVTRADLEAAGLTPEDVPVLVVIDPPSREAP
jgi:hypothetical protein